MSTLHATPGVSAPLRRPAPAHPLHGLRVAVVLFSHYPTDPRPRRAAEALARQGAHVQVISLKGRPEDPLRRTLQRVELLQLPVSKTRGGKLAYLYQYSAFLLLAAAILAWRTLQGRYRLVHVHNMPDFLVFSALVPKLCGARVVLDLHDPMPELMTTIFGVAPTSKATRLLRWLEKCSIGFADRVLTVNEACRQLFAARSCPAAKIAVVMNSPDEGMFRFRAPPFRPLGSPEARFVVMYHGSLVERHGLDLAVAALGRVREVIPGAELRIFGKPTAFLREVLCSVEGTPLGAAVRYLGEKDLEDIVPEIVQCDVGIIPNRRSIFTEINTPTRIFEYISQGRPVVAPRSRGILDYFGPDELFLFELGNAADLAAQILAVWREPERARASVLQAQTVCRRLRWSVQRHEFMSVVHALVRREPGVEAVPGSTPEVSS